MQVCIPHTPYSSTMRPNWNVGVWSRERFTAGPSKEKVWLMLRNPSGFLEEIFIDKIWGRGFRVWEFFLLTACWWGNRAVFQGSCAQPEVTILHLGGQTQGDNEGQGSLPTALYGIAKSWHALATEQQPGWGPQLLQKNSKIFLCISLEVVCLCCWADYAKAFDCVDRNKLWKILKEMGIPDHLTCLLRYLYAGQEATFRTGHGTTDWFQTGKGVHQGCILSPCLFNLYVEYVMRNTELYETQAGIKIAGRNINNLRYADDTTLMAESKELKSLLRKWKRRVK